MLALRGFGRRAADRAPGEAPMYALVRSLPFGALITTQGLPFAAAFLIAELFYKFHSFALECLGFLATWFVLDAAFALLRKAFARPATARGS